MRGLKLLIFAFAAASCVHAGSASALTNDNGVVVFTQADALAGGVTPGDAPGFPVTISSPGSYRLGSNLSVPQEYGIVVPAAEVTLDLGGFRMIGGGVAWVAIKGTGRALTVRNGTVRAFTSRGVEYSNPSGSFGQAVSLLVEGMRFESISSTAIDAYFASNVLIRQNIILDGLAGVSCGPSCHLEDNLIHGTTEAAIGVRGSATILGNLINQTGPAYTTFTFSGQEFPATVGFGDNYRFNTATPRPAPLNMAPNACTSAC